jgi:hypothetical protein
MGVGGAGDERRSLSGMTPAERQAFMGIIRVLPNGQTMGAGPQYDDVDYTEDDLPDFIAWYNDQGWDNGEKLGYVRKADYLNPGPPPSSPAEAVAMMEQQRNEGPRVIPVFGDDGKTVIGQLPMNDNEGVTVTEITDEDDAPAWLDESGH